MNKRYVVTPLIVMLCLSMAPAAFGQAGLSPDTEVETVKRAQTGMKFLSMSVDARAAAIGSAMTAQWQGSSTSMLYNPASMAFMPGSFHVGAGNLGFIADINYNQATAAFRPSGGNLGVFGISWVNVDYGDFIGTIRAANDNGFVETGVFSPTSMAVGFGYARSFSDRFSAGANIKMAVQDFVGEFTTSQNFETGDVLSTDTYRSNTVAFDFGILYSTGFRSLVIGMSARNFSRDLTYVRERFELPLTFQIGAAIDIIDFTSMDPNVHSVMAHIDAQRPRDFDEHIRFGLEYTFMNIVSLRGGFEQAAVSEEQGFSLGAGLNYDMGSARFGADYAFTDFGLFGSVNRIALHVGM